jgi:F-type H+-transporting ATPase subunit delta
MKQVRIAGRYAKSLIELAQEQNQLDTVYNDMQYLQAACKTSKEFYSMLQSPIIKADKKEKIVSAITEGKISNLTHTFNKLVISKGREVFLPEIAQAFIGQYKDIKNIVTATLTTATEASPAMQEQIKVKVAQALPGKAVELVTKIDESIIGGFILEVGGKVVNASISYDLKNIAKQFEKNDFVYNVR